MPSVRNARRDNPRASVGSKRTVSTPQPKWRQLPPLRACRSWWNIGKWLIGSVVTAIGIAASVAELRGPFWPTQPSFATVYPSYGQPLDARFYVTNNSWLFWLRDLKVYCVLLEVKIFANQTHMSFNGVSVSSGINSTVQPEETVRYRCPFHGALAAFGVPPEYDVIEAKIGFISEYASSLPWVKNVTVKSDVFFLDKDTSPPQWTRGFPIP